MAIGFVLLRRAVYLENDRCWTHCKIQGVSAGGMGSVSFVIELRRDRAGAIDERSPCIAA